MKTHAQAKQAKHSSIEAKAKNQANESSILQAYKNGTSQLVEDVEPVQRQENKTGLPDNLKSGVENLSGHSLDDVKVHYGSSKPAELQAHAYAQGSDIHIAPGQEKHLPHEAWHVAQQKQGRVQATKQLKGTVPVNDDAGLEKEADVMGAKAMQLKENFSGSSLQLKTTSSDTTQLKTTIDYGNLTDFTFKNKNVDVTDKVGTTMKAHLDPKFPETGTDTSGSTAFNDLFAALQKYTTPSWVRGHLLNHDLGGVAHYNNLFPITTAANGEHYHEVEKIVKHWVGKGCEVDYNVTAEKSGDDATPEGTFDCEATVTNDPNSGSPLVGKQINKTIHSKVTKTSDTHVFEKSNNKSTSKFSKVDHNMGNDIYRDTYKGALSKNSKWNHKSGNSKNNIFLHDSEIFNGKDVDVLDEIEMDDVDSMHQTNWIQFLTIYSISGGILDGDIANEIMEQANSEANDLDELHQIIIDELDDEGFTVTKK